MNTLILLLGGVAWIALFVAAVGIGHRVAEMRWRRQARERAFDRMVEEYRHQQAPRRTP